MRTNIFKLLNIESKENFHSRFIAAIVENDANAKELFIEMLRSKILNKDLIHTNFSRYKFQNEKVLRETNGESRADIYITDYQNEKDPGETRIIIENKIYASDQKDQLLRYHKFLSDKFDKCALFYLTIEGKSATKYSKKNLSEKKDYFLLSYNINIRQWLEELMKIESLDPNLKLYINDYIKVIEDITRSWNVLNQNYVADKKAESAEERSYLELKLWEYINDEILNRYGSSIVKGVSDKRLFTYDKIRLCQNNKEVQRDYGIIFQLTDCTEIRVGVTTKGKNRFQIFISKGNMNIENKWVGEPVNLEYKTNMLINKSQMIEIGGKIIEELKNWLI